MIASSLLPDRRVLLGIGLVCFANIMLEVVLTRMFSALMYYHFTFFAIALALLGMGASGVYVYVRADRFQGDVRLHLSRHARWFAISVLVALIYVLANPIAVVTGGDSPRFSNQTLFQLILLNAFTGVPFFFAGVVVSLAITHYRSAIERIYFYDLFGAGLAALLAGLLISSMGAPAVVVAVTLCSAVAAVLLAPQASRRDLMIVAGAAVLVALALGTSLFALPSVKGVKTGRLLFEGWNTFSRVTVEKVKDVLEIKIDASAATRVTPAKESKSSAWQRQISALAYAVHDGGAQDVLIIGPGGGRDVAHALASGARTVTGVEVNPLIAQTIMRERFGPAAGDLYADPRVDIVIDEGRSYIRRSRRQFDVIQASLVDTWAATSAGAFALTENTLYTLEAFGDYYEHLTDRGVITMSRWHTSRDPETTRLVMLAAGALEKRGVPPGETRRYLMLARRDQLGTLLARRTPFSPEEVARLEESCRQARFEIVVSPTGPARNQLEKLVDAGAWSADARAFEHNILPPTDDQPFFFYFVKPGRFWNLRQYLRSAPLTNPAVWILIALATILIALTILFVFVPLVMTRLGDLRGANRADNRRRLLGLGYFACIGLGFMVVEIGLIQRLSLFLGHPSYALIVVLFSVLISTAIGARLSQRIAEHRRATVLVAAGLATAALALFGGFGLPAILHDLVAQPLPTRIALSVATVAVFGVVMGMMLPFGVRMVSAHDSRILPWAWGINGGMSVIGTVVATVIAIHAGFTATFVTGALIYLVAGANGAIVNRLVARRSPLA